MYYALVELLSREEIVQILRERKLQVENIDALQHDELLRIYKTFAVPLAQREPKTKKVNGVIPSPKTTTPASTESALSSPSTLKRRGADISMEMDYMQEIPAASAATELKRPRLLSAAEETVAIEPLGKTRARSPTEEMLSIVTKRCKITNTSD